MCRTVNSTRTLALTGMVLILSAMAASQASAQCNTGNCGGAVDSFAAGFGSGRYASGNSGSYGYGVQPPFHNYFTTGAADQANAALYISPVGVPGWVGHTYITYQPFNPHEYTWIHKDRYHSYYDNGRGLNRTSAHYYAPPARTAASRIYKMIEIPH